MGQTREVEAFVLIAKETVEEEMYALAMSKKKVMNGLVSGCPGLDAVCLIGKPTQNLEEDELPDTADTSISPELAQHLLTDEEYPLSVLHTTLSKLETSPRNRDPAPLGPPSSPTPFDQGFHTPSLTIGRPTPAMWSDSTSADHNQHEISSPSQETHPPISNAPVSALAQRLFPNDSLCQGPRPGGEEKTPHATSADVSVPGLSEELLLGSQHWRIYSQQRVEEHVSFSPLGSDGCDQYLDTRQLDGSGSCPADQDEETVDWDAATSSRADEDMLEPCPGEIMSIDERLPHDRGSITVPTSRFQETGPDDGEEDPIGLSFNFDHESGIFDQESTRTDRERSTRLHPRRQWLSHISVESLPEHVKSLYVRCPNPPARSSSQRSGNEEHLSDERQISLPQLLQERHSSREAGSEESSSDEWMSQPSEMIRSLQETLDELSQDEVRDCHFVQRFGLTMVPPQSLSSYSSNSLPEIPAPTRSYQDSISEDEARDQALPIEESEVSGTDSTFDPNSSMDEDSENGSSARPTRATKSKSGKLRSQNSRKCNCVTFAAQ